MIPRASQPTDATTQAGQTNDATGPTSDAAMSSSQPPPQDAERVAPRALDPAYEAEIAAIEDDLLAEIARVQREAAERERTLIAERDAYRAQLQFATDT